MLCQLRLELSRIVRDVALPSVPSNPFPVCRSEFQNFYPLGPTSLVTHETAGVAPRSGIGGTYVGDSSNMHCAAKYKYGRERGGGG